MALYIPGMSHEVHGLENFYATPAGLVTARLLRDRLRTFWPGTRGMTVLGLGYASPFLRLWKAEAALRGQRQRGRCGGRVATQRAASARQTRRKGLA